MKEEEFKKKLESILGNLYKIDREVKEYFKGRNAVIKEKILCNGIIFRVFNGFSEEELLQMRR